MFLKAGALSLALLVASRLLGLARESAQAAVFGASGLGDVAVLMLTLPDWLASVLASGALAYVLLPAWAGQSGTQVALAQRRVAGVLIGAGVILGLALVLARAPVLDVLAPGLGQVLRAPALQALLWTAPALPLALLAALWATRLQHERDFVGMYGANLVVNAALIAALVLLALAWGPQRIAASVLGLGLGLLTAMGLRLAWLGVRQRALIAHTPAPDTSAPTVPGAGVWLWAMLAAGLPLALPFTARSIASATGEGALATFNYAWKLVELPLMLAVQLVATLAFPAVARALASAETAPAHAADAVRPAFALAWVLACAAAAGLLLAAPALAQLLFGWGRMDRESLARVAQWGSIGAWGLLPQALIAVGLTVLAAQRRMQVAVWAYAAAFLALLVLGAARPDGGALMAWLNGLYALIAAAVMLALGRAAWGWLPWRALAAAFVVLLPCAVLARISMQLALWMQLALAVAGAAAVLGAAVLSSPDVRRALRR